MKRTAILLLSVTLDLIVMLAGAQNTLYFMDRLPQRLSLNPAMVPKVDFFIGMPGISGERAEIFSSGLDVGNILDLSDQLDTEEYDPDDFISRIGEYNDISAETRSNLFSMGFRLKEKGYFSMSVSIRSNVEMSLPSKMLYLLDDLDDVRDRLPIQINNLTMTANTFSEMAFTYSRTFGERLTLGISPKLIGALGGIKTENFRMGADEIRTDVFEGNMGGRIEIGLPVEINPQAINSDGKLNPDKPLLRGNWEKSYGSGDFFKNISLAFDLGANYNLNDKWSFSASIIDLGRTRWNENGYLFSLKDTTYVIDEEESGFPDLNSAYTVTQNHSTTIKIPARFYLGVNYKLSTNWNAGLLMNQVFRDKGGKTAATLSLNGYIGRMLSASLSYTAASKVNDLGMGLRLRILPGMDLYAITDNLISSLNYRNINHANIAAGLNFSFGVKNRGHIQPEENIETEEVKEVQEKVF